MYEEALKPSKRWVEVSATKPLSVMSFLPIHSLVFTSNLLRRPGREIWARSIWKSSDATTYPTWIPPR
jgi:hypothetical protein